MNWKTTLILVILAGAGGAWMYLDMRREEETPAVESTLGPLLPEVPYVDATQLILDRPAVPEAGAQEAENPARERIVFERRGEAWVIVEPVEAAANREHVEEMLEEPCIRVPMEGRKLADTPEAYGLGLAAVTVTIVYPGGRATARIGRRSEFQGNQYAMAEGAGVVKLMDPEFSGVFLRPLADYRASKSAPPTEKSAENPDGPPSRRVQP